MDTEIYEDSSDEYDPDSSSDTSDEEVFYGSEYDLIDDDKLFENNVDRDGECSCLEPSEVTHDVEYASVVPDLANSDGHYG